MASTIIIKNGTGSAVPSSLNQGELAINVDKGALYYGTSGSINSVSSSFTFSHITASGNISASGHNYQLGELFKIDQQGLYVGDGGYLTSKLYLGPVAGDKQYPLINANALYEMQFQRGSLETPLLKLHFAQHSSRYSTVHVSGSLRVQDGVGAVGSLYTDGAITASSNISASGNILATDVYASSDVRAVDGFFMTDTQGGTVLGSLDYTEGSLRLTPSSGDPASHGIFVVSSSGGTATANARIGIGTETPGEMLTVMGNISSSGRVDALTVNPTRITGGVRSLSLTAQTTTGSNAQGDIFYSENSINTDAGKIYKLQTNGNITLADKDEELSAHSLLTVAIGSNSQTHGLLLKGMVKLHTDPCPGGSHLGEAIYMGDSGLATGSIAGHASDDFIRIMGHYISGSGTIYFNPDNTFIKKA